MRNSVAIWLTCYLIASHCLIPQPGTAQESLRDLNAHCPFQPPSTQQQWQQRASQLKQQLQVSLGLYPQLELDPVAPEIYGAVQRDQYTIAKVTFDSLPGFKVTGNLYRPKNLAAGAKVPGILSPHGHWTDARFYATSPAEQKRLLASGAERFAASAENHIQARCVQLARMGCVVFHWDMIGYCDSTQIDMQRAHRYITQDDQNEATEDGWLLFSPLAESHAQSILGLQALATQRAVDMLLSLPEVDPDRLAITGASGGGTQSFIGAALDERIGVAFPAVMVSTGMQGGCTCENACWLRTGTGNVELAALIAPRPLGLTAADDWTRDMASDGYPQLQTIYAMFGVQEQVGLFPAVHFGHNFNHVSRVAMYGWMNDHLQLGYEKPILEEDFVVAHRDELSVWDAQHPAPPGGPRFERQLMKLWAELAESKLYGLLRGDQQQRNRLSEILRNGWSVCLGLTSAELVAAKSSQSPSGLTLTSLTDGKWRITMPEEENAAGGVTINVGADVYHFAMKNANQPLVETSRIGGEVRKAAAFTYGYNLPEFARQARRLALTLQHLALQSPTAEFRVSGEGSAAALAAAGLFCLQQAHPDAVPEDMRLRLSPGDFQFAEIDSIEDANFLPAAARFWDLTGLLASLSHTAIEIDPKTLKVKEIERLLESHSVRILEK